MGTVFLLFCVLSQNKDQNKNPQDRQKDSPLPEGTPPQNQNSSAGQEEKPRSFDKEQAQGLLEAMAGEEKLLKDELKKRMKRNYKYRNVEKDW